MFISILSSFSLLMSVSLGVPKKHPGFRIFWILPVSKQQGYNWAWRETHIWAEKGGEWPFYT